MDKLTDSIQQTAKKLLEEGKVELVIGFEDGTLPLRGTPCFIRRPEDVKRLTWNSSCENNLAKYLPGRKGKVAVVAKGCDSRAIVGLIQEKQVERDNVVIIGVPCRGMLDRDAVARELEGKELLSAEEKNGDIILKGAGFEKSLPRTGLLHRSCLTCRHPGPVVYDFLLGEKAPEAHSSAEYDDIKDFEKKSAAERWDYITGELDKCIRCYACRQACAFCYCRECFVDATRPRWIGKTSDAVDTQLFHIVRALHLAGRCVSCGACERACPMGVDLRVFNKKLEEDIEELFGYKAGLDMEEVPPLATFKPDDRQEFIK